jgi:hypothetical protein
MRPCSRVLIFGSHRRLRSECSYERNNDHRENCISHCHLHGIRDGWQLRLARAFGRYVELVLLLSIQTLDPQQLPLAEFLALEAF